jgi:hypothetical protein
MTCSISKNFPVRVIAITRFQIVVAKKIQRDFFPLETVFLGWLGWPILTLP